MPSKRHSSRFIPSSPFQCLCCLPALGTEADPNSIELLLVPASIAMASDSEQEYYSDFEASVDSRVTTARVHGARSPLKSQQRPHSRNTRSGGGQRGAPPEGAPISDLFFSGLPLDSNPYDSDHFEEPSFHHHSPVRIPEQSTEEEYEEEFYESPTTAADPQERIQDDSLCQPTVTTADHLGEFSSVTFHEDSTVVKGVKRRKKKTAGRQVHSAGRLSPKDTKGPGVASADSKTRPRVNKLPPKGGSVSSNSYAARHVMERIGLPAEKSEYSSATNQKPIGSSVASAMQHGPGELLRQLNVLNKKYEQCRRENASLLDKMDNAKFQETVERFTTELALRDDRIVSLEAENTSLRQVIRFQEKHLTQKEAKQQHEEEYHGNEKYMEMVAGQLRQLKERNMQQRQAIADHEELNKELTDTVERLRKKNASLRRFKEKVTQERLRISEQTDGGQPLPAEGSIVSKLDEQSVITKDDAVEKGYQLQLGILQREVASLKLTIAEHGQGSKRLQAELDKRESFINVQNFRMKELKKKYEDLLEGNKQLMQATALITRDRAVNKAPPPKPVVRIPIPPAAPALAPLAKNAMLADDEEAVDGPSDMTFLTNSFA